MTEFGIMELPIEFIVDVDPFVSDFYFLSKPNCISDHHSLRRMFSAFLFSGDKSGFIQIGALKEMTLESTIMASVDHRNFIRIGLG